MTALTVSALARLYADCKPMTVVKIASRHGMRFVTASLRVCYTHFIEQFVYVNRLHSRLPVHFEGPPRAFESLLFGLIP